MVDGPNVYGYCNNDPINFVDPWGLWTIQIGFSGSGGGSTGGQAGVGIVFGYGKKQGWQFGFYEMVGGGSYVGAGGSATVDITWSNNPDIDYLKGKTLTTGGSGGEIFSAGGEANFPLDKGVAPSFTASGGVGAGPVPGEGHAFYVHTWIQKVGKKEKKSGYKK